jgi:hypothetical protein
MYNAQVKWYPTLYKQSTHTHIYCMVQTMSMSERARCNENVDTKSEKMVSICESYITTH